MITNNFEHFRDLADLFSNFANPTRLRIFELLLKNEKNVSQIADELQMNQSAISHQLKKLKEAGLLKSKRQGREIIYSLADDHVTTILQQGLAHLDHLH